MSPKIPIGWPRALTLLLLSFQDQERHDFPAWLDFSLRGKERKAHQLALLLLNEFSRTADLTSMPPIGRIWEELYPESPFKQARINHLAETVKREAEAFLITQSLAREVATQNRLLLKELSRRLPQHEFDKYLRRYQKSRLYQAEDHKREDVAIEWARLYMMSQNANIREKPMLKNQLDALERKIDRTYLEEKAKVVFSRLSLFPELHDQRLADFLRRLESYSESQDQEFLALLALMGGAIQGDSGAFSMLMKKWQMLRESIPDYLSNACFQLLISQKASVRNQTQSRETGLQSIQLIITGIDNQYAFQNGQLPGVVLKNLILLACELQGTGTASQYLDQYLPFVSVDEQAESESFNLGMIKYYSGQYPEVARRFSQVSFQKYYHQFHAEVLVLKSLFMLNPAPDFSDNPTVRFRLGALQRMLRTSPQVPIGTVKRFKGFVKYFRKLIRFPEPDQRLSIRGALQADLDVAEKQWLLDQFFPD